MKKVFLSLAVIATLTVVSCKQADAEATETVDSTVVEEVAAPVMDSVAPVMDSVAPAVEAPAAH
jgi:hypothetical protein